ncbi:MAG: tetratricopeptide repeat protein [Bacteroides sp.]|nr:tetratricopeptide repeat protein [Bacteroides sp.]
MRKFSILLCLCTCCSFLTAQNTSPIQEAMANYDYETVLSLIEQEPPTLPLLYQKGNALKGLKRTKEALSVFREIAEQDSLNPRAYIEAAECYKALAQYSETLAYYEEAIRLNPENTYARLQYINMLMGMKRYRESLKESSLLAEKDSSAYVLHLRAESMGWVYDNTEITRVIDAYLDIQRRYPDDYLAAAKLGNIYVAGHQYEDAIDITEKYRSIDSTNILVNRVNAQAYCLNKDYPKAIERYEQLLQEKDSTFQTCFYAGISYYALENFYPAHDLLKRALKEDRNNINLLYYLGRACSKTSWKKEGVEYLETAINLTIPNDSIMSRLYVGLADCYKMAQQYADQAKALLTQYEKYDRQKHKLLYDVAFIYYYRLKNVPKAEHYLTAYLKTRPKGDKEKAQEVDADGVPIIGETNRYNAAENWLKDIREKRKKEEFFKGKVDTSSVAPVR